MPYRKNIISVVISVLLFFQLASCSALLPETNTTDSESAENAGEMEEKTADTQDTTPLVEVVFSVSVPVETPSNSSIYLDILDEVTGLALNTHRYPMEYSGEGKFELTINSRVGSILKYRYALENSPISLEKNSSGESVRYRVYYVESPAIVEDRVTSWSGSPYAGETGRIQGYVSDATNSPLPDILVTAGGKQTITAADGSFLIEGLLPGTHNLTAVSLNGNYEPFQQGALIAEDSTTPANIQLAGRRSVNMTFVISLPEGIIKGVPVRMVGNLYSFGNTYADLAGGVSTVSSRAPLMEHQEDGTYKLTVALPEGTDFRYKYSLGDGFWNSELDEQGQFEVRQLIVPSEDTVIQDEIAGLQREGYAPFTFRVYVPENTPASDVISIQFNPYGWTEAIPMWPIGENEWFYVLYSPLHMTGQVSYRYCRNDQCDTSYFQSSDMSFGNESENHKIEDTITGWHFFETEMEPGTVVGADVTSREDFTTAVELVSQYNPNWQSYLGNAYDNIVSLGADWVISSPTWQFTSQNPPTLEPVTGIDALWYDQVQTASWLTYKNLDSALFPRSIISGDENEWWLNAKRDDGWWQSYFDRYRTFLIHHAELAQKTFAKALIIGDENFWMAQSKSLLADESETGIFGDANERWSVILSEIRTVYDGELILAVNYPDQINMIPEFVSEFDKIYILFSAPMGFIGEDELTESLVQEKVNEMLDNGIKPLVEEFEKPVILGFKVPSSEDIFSDCVSINEECVSVDDLDQPSEYLENANVNLENQKIFYSAVLQSINERDWIKGIVSRGYYPPLELNDASSSIYGKPVSSLLWYWFPKFGE